jgi:3'-phosphoadenosine 5'-phosphosulfate sulfotransferase (PAPS reductase)/FAD synthetase
LRTNGNLQSRENEKRASSPSGYDVALFAERLAQAKPDEIIAEAAKAMPGRLAVVSSFGTESAVLLKLVADVNPSLPILFLDTLWLFKETLAYRDALVARLGLTDVRTITPSPSALALRDAKPVFPRGRTFVWRSEWLGSAPNSSSLEGSALAWPTRH